MAGWKVDVIYPSYLPLPCLGHRRSMSPHERQSIAAGKAYCCRMSPLLLSFARLDPNAVVDWGPVEASSSPFLASLGWAVPWGKKTRTKPILRPRRLYFGPDNACTLGTPITPNLFFWSLTSGTPGSLMFDERSFKQRRSTGDLLLAAH